jgi:hypothetical protein
MTIAWCVIFFFASIARPFTSAREWLAAADRGSAMSAPGP